MATLNERGEIDPAQGVIITCTGRKGSGKSVMGTYWFQRYPGDRLVIDVAGDDGPAGPDVHTLTGATEQLPTSWPEHLREYDDAGNSLPLILRYTPDAGSPTAAADIDHMVGLAFEHGFCAIMVHEIGIVAPVHQTQPHMRRVLMHNRHHQVTAIFCGPRPRGIDALVIAQSDLIYVFDTPNVEDRKYLAQTMGQDFRTLDDAHRELRQHEFLLFDAHGEKPDPDDPDAPDLRLVHYPALPKDVVDDVQRWAWPNGKPTKVRDPR